ncbi:protein of unknown function [Methanocaldococcus lauensis]|uniref:Uncharacterized protein n=1 Tax=Methanocaldococcus lauensis TaxID=2546128 RepID=A0A8D6PU82_9EURY|nr:protein of unknown function [Methanocaldococcus lauensis]
MGLLKQGWKHFFLDKLDKQTETLIEIKEILKRIENHFNMQK